MAYKEKTSKCKICADKYLQTRAANVVCPKTECKTANQRQATREYKKRVKNGEPTAQVYQPKVSDTSTPEVRLNNIFILGQLNTCNAELVKLSLS